MVCFDNKCHLNLIVCDAAHCRALRPRTPDEGNPCPVPLKPLRHVMLSQPHRLCRMPRWTWTYATHVAAQLCDHKQPMHASCNGGMTTRRRTAVPRSFQGVRG